MWSASASDVGSDPATWGTLAPRRDPVRDTDVVKTDLLCDETVAAVASPCSIASVVPATTSDANGDGLPAWPLMTSAPVLVAALPSSAWTGSIKRPDPPRTTCVAPKPRARGPLARHGDVAYAMSTGDQPRNGLGAILDLLRAVALATSDYDEATQTFVDPDSVWLASSVSLDHIEAYFDGSFQCLAFRKHKSESKGFGVARYIETFLRRETYLDWDCGTRRLSFNRFMTGAIFQRNGAKRTVPGPDNPTHTSNFKAAFYNAVHGHPVPFAIVDWARQVVAGRAWLHSSHYKKYCTVSGDEPDKLPTRKRDDTSLTGRTIVVVKRDRCLVSPLASTPTRQPRSPSKRTQLPPSPLAPTSPQHPRSPAKRARL